MKQTPETPETRTVTPETVRRRADTLAQCLANPAGTTSTTAAVGNASRGHSSLLNHSVPSAPHVASSSQQPSLITSSHIMATSASSGWGSCRASAPHATAATSDQRSAKVIALTSVRMAGQQIRGTLPIPRGARGIHRSQSYRRSVSLGAGGRVEKSVSHRDVDRPAPRAHVLLSKH
jgi:hypothetical protein